MRMLDHSEDDDDKDDGVIIITTYPSQGTHSLRQTQA